MSLGAVIFDVDGTLAETEELHRRAFNQVFAEAGLGWYWDRALYGQLLAVAGGVARLFHYRDQIGGGPDDTTLRALHRRKTLRYGALLARGEIAPRPGVDAALAACRATGLRLAIATSTSRVNVDALCRACWGCAAHEIFAVIASGDEVTAAKPDPALYRLALARLALPPGAALAIEDSAIGLASARAAGLACLVTPARYTARQDFSAADQLVQQDLAAAILARL